METHVPSREEALTLLTRYNDSEVLINHALAVEAVMRHMARKSGGDEDTWGIVGLAHDIDYEKYPAEHCAMSEKILAEHGWPPEYIRAVVSHGWGICNDVQPESLMERTLYAVDELTGLVAATALVRPSRSVRDLTAKSVMKKWKQPSFAAGVNRELVQRGADMLGMELRDLMTDVIEGMRTVAEDIGL